jgi:ATP-dependent DNA helicase RecG
MIESQNIEKKSLKLVHSKAKGIEYFIDEKVLKKLDFKGKTSIKNIEKHRLKELIYQDILGYSHSSFGEIHERIGLEIQARKVGTELYSMLGNKDIMAEGKLKNRKYFIDKKL